MRVVIIFWCFVTKLYGNIDGIQNIHIFSFIFILWPLKYLSVLLLLTFWVFCGHIILGRRCIDFFRFSWFESVYLIDHFFKIWLLFTKRDDITNSFKLVVWWGERSVLRLGMILDRLTCYVWKSFVLNLVLRYDSVSRFIEFNVIFLDQTVNFYLYVLKWILNVFRMIRRLPAFVHCRAGYHFWFFFVLTRWRYRVLWCFLLLKSFANVQIFPYWAFWI
jgi:hypothetical protein